MSHAPSFRVETRKHHPLNVFSSTCISNSSPTSTIKFQSIKMQPIFLLRFSVPPAIHVYSLATRSGAMIHCRSCLRCFHYFQMPWIRHGTLPNQHHFVITKSLLHWTALDLIARRSNYYYRISFLCYKAAWACASAVTQIQDLNARFN